MELNFEGIRDGAAMTQEEGELLYALVRATKPKSCIETGTHAGLSASYIGSALKENGCGFLHTYDPFDYNAPANLQQFSGWIEYHKNKGIEAKIDSPIDFLFIDGYHEKEEVLMEFLYFKPYLAPNALVVFHDCWDSAPDAVAFADVNGAVRELGLKTTMIPTHNHMRIYEHSGV